MAFSKLTSLELEATTYAGLDYDYDESSRKKYSLFINMLKHNAETLEVRQFK